MTLYITPDNKLHDDADGFALTLPTWPKNAVLATQEQIDAILNPPASIQNQIDTLKASMAAIEAEQYMIRGAREAWLVLMENTAAGQGVTIEQLYAANPFYKKIKDADNEIAAMRLQISDLEAQL